MLIFVRLCRTPDKSRSHIPMLCTVMSILGLMILYQRYMICTSILEFGHFPVRQNGWVNDASTLKYFSMVFRWVDGGDWVKRWITSAISLTGFSMINCAAMDIRDRGVWCSMGWLDKEERNCRGIIYVDMWISMTSDWNACISEYAQAICLKCFVHCLAYYMLL